MELGVVSWFDSLTGTLMSAAIALLVLVNGAFAVGVLRSRSRAFVDRWTPRVVITDAALLLALVGAPVANLAVGLLGKGAALLINTPAAAVTPDGK
jgi:steroid 5-alpha reductase family enzyme